MPQPRTASFTPSSLAGITGGLTAPLSSYQEEQRLIAEGKTLVTHSHGRIATGGREARKLGEEEWAAFDLSEIPAGLRDVYRKLFLREREEGWIAAGQFENVTELPGVFGEGPLAPLGGAIGKLIGGHGGSTPLHINPKTGEAHTTGKPGTGEEIQKAVPEVGGWLGGVGQLIGAYALRGGEILFGATLVIFGLVTLAKGRPPDVVGAAKKVAPRP